MAAVSGYLVRDWSVPYFPYGASYGLESACIVTHYNTPSNIILRRFVTCVIILHAAALAQNRLEREKKAIDAVYFRRTNRGP